MIKLYDYFRSSACFRVRIALELKGISYTKNIIHLVSNGGEQHSSEYVKINNQHLVPTMDDNGQILTQSLAIIEYLDEIYPSPPLLPSHPFDKARVRAFALSIAADVHPLNNLRVLKYISNELKIANDEKQRWYHHWIELGFTALETQLSQNTHASEFCFGSNPTLADICLIPQWYNARRFNCDLTPYPTLRRIYEACENIPAFSNSFPEETTA